MVSEAGQAIALAIRPARVVFPRIQKASCHRQVEADGQAGQRRRIVPCSTTSEIYWGAMMRRLRRSLAKGGESGSFAIRTPASERALRRSSLADRVLA